LQVLVLNQNYEPLNLCADRRAFVLVDKGKAEILERFPNDIPSAHAFHPRASVIRMMYYVNRPRPVVKLTRREVFARDNYTCQYCGRRESDSTIDHVYPKFRGGTRSWENLVTSCKPCNRRKGGRSPREAGMRLRRRPRHPVVTPGRMILRRANGHIHGSWEPFLLPKVRRAG
jgi:5-methylcytosine-specific restriction endonuclease McrA